MAILADVNVARAYRFSIDTSVIGQAYAVRGFRETGDVVLSRRRLSTALRLSIWNMIGPDLSQMDPAPKKSFFGKKATLTFVSDMRFGTDFGSFLESGAISGSGTVDEPGIAELSDARRDLSLLYAYVEGRAFFDRIDFRIGRQITSDLLDWFAFDGITLRVRAPLATTFEVTAGFEVRGNRSPLFGTPLYELDGNSVGSELTEQLAPTYGGAIELAAPKWLHARVSYRRTQSKGLTGDGAIDDDLVALGIDDESQVLEEKVGASARATLLGGKLAIYGALRANLLVHRFDTVLGGASVQRGRHAISADFEQATPTWSGDSIFNVFTQYPYEDARVTYSYTSDCLRAFVRGVGRWFHNHACQYGGAGSDLDCSNDEAGNPIAVATRTPDMGGGAGAEWLRGRTRLRGELSVQSGFGGRDVGAEFSGRYALRPGARAPSIDGRVSVVQFENTLKANQSATSIGVLAGLRWPWSKRIVGHLWLEENVNRFVKHELRAIGVLDFSFGEIDP